MILILLIAIMFILCLFLYRPGFKFFLFWLGVCAAVFYFLAPSIGLWGFLNYFIILGGDFDTESRNSTQDDSPAVHQRTGSSVKYDQHSGSSYHPGGGVDYLPNGNSSVRYGNVTYMSNRIRSTGEGSVTYFFDDNTGKRLGRSVDNCNGIFYYFDDNGREIGHSYRSGDVIDYFGDCFECR